jgi:hypothetical protein
VGKAQVNEEPGVSEQKAAQLAGGDQTFAKTDQEDFPEAASGWACRRGADGWSSYRSTGDQFSREKNARESANRGSWSSIGAIVDRHTGAMQVSEQ